MSDFGELERFCTRLGVWVDAKRAEILFRIEAESAPIAKRNEAGAATIADVHSKLTGLDRGQADALARLLAEDRRRQADAEAIAELWAEASMFAEFRQAIAAAIEDRD